MYSPPLAGGGAFIEERTFSLGELFSSTLFLPLRPRWWGGRTFIEEWNLSWWVLALIPLPLDPVTG